MKSDQSRHTNTFIIASEKGGQFFKDITVCKIVNSYKKMKDKSANEEAA